MASGVVFNSDKSKDNAFIFLAFTIYTFTLSMNTFFGYSATIDVENNITTEVLGLLSINQTHALHLVATLFFAIGFGIKAYSILKKYYGFNADAAEKNGSG